MMDERNGGNRPNPTPTPTPTATPTPTPPYGFYFARWAIGAGSIAFVATIVALIAFTAELDSAAVTGALGALFTLIGTVSGAYFGIKRSSDTEDKGREAERAANEGEREANRVARDAAGALEPTTYEGLKDKGIV